MMLRRLLLVTTAGALAAIPAAAQRPVSVSLAGGATLPTATLRDRSDLGWHALGALALTTLTQPLGLRLDVAYNRFPFSDDFRAAAGSDGSESIGSATLNFTYRLPMTNSPVSPYLISGAGAYRTECEGPSGCDAVTRYGWNVGAGLKLYTLGLPAFIEARLHRTERGGRMVQFVPVTIGLRF